MIRPVRLLLTFLLCALALPLPGCGPEPQVIPSPTPTAASEPSSPKGSSLEEKVARLTEQLKVVASRSICSPQVRMLIRRMKHECGLEQCSSDVIQYLVREVDAYERFLWVLRDMPHEVIYLREDGSKKAASDLIALDRQERLLRLIEPPWLDFSEILIIGHSGSRESMRDLAAMNRALKVKEFILSSRFARGQRLSPARVHAMPYSFPLRRPSAKQSMPNPERNEYTAMLELLNKNILLERDLPLSAEPSDINRGVWVFVIDCASDLWTYENRRS